MTLIKQINNNAALAIDNNGNEVVLLERGIGFNSMPYELTDLSRIERSYYNIDAKYLELISSLDESLLDAASTIVELAIMELDCELNPNFAITLADHIRFAIKREEKNIIASNAMAYDVLHLYRKEYQIGQQAISIIEEKTGVRLSDSEIVNIALHVIDAELEQENIHETMLLLKIIEQIDKIISESLSIVLDKESFSYARFIMHLRFLFQRLEKNDASESQNYSLFRTVAREYPDILETANQVSRFLNEEKGWVCNEDELLYLMIHINRVRERS